ncbi:unnamed protein product, partial [Urochloa humidicola]
TLLLSPAPSLRSSDPVRRHPSMPAFLRSLPTDADAPSTPPAPPPCGPHPSLPINAFGLGGHLCPAALDPSTQPAPAPVARRMAGLQLLGQRSRRWH